MAQRVVTPRQSGTSGKAAVCLLCALLFLSAPCRAQQRPPFSEKKVEEDGRLFMPFTRGEIEKRISGSNQALFGEICSILCSWDSIAPPQGIKVSCYSDGYELEIRFLPYLFEEGERVTVGSGSSLTLSLNNPLQMLGSPLVEDIFLSPQKSADFHGFPIYRNDRHEVTIVSKKSVPLFIPVSQEEYLKKLIADEEKKNPGNSSTDTQTVLREMEQAYQELLKSDKVAAKEFKQQMDEFRAEASASGEGSDMPNVVTSLKKELSALTAAERVRQACYGGISAMEAFHNLSGLVPEGSEVSGEPLVRANPALIDPSSANRIQLLTIRWLVGEGENADKPRFYNEGREGFSLADHLMSTLYANQKIWARILAL